MAQDIYQKITDLIVAQLEQGVVAWRKPWVAGNAINLVSRKPYRGINAMILATAPFKSPYWITFNQAKELGGSVKKGAKGYPIIFWTTFEKEAEDGETKSFPVLRNWTVFNVEQCDGVDYPVAIERQFNQIDTAEAILTNMPHKPGYTHLGGDRAYYDVLRDCVNMPKREWFVTDAAYYSTAFHELVHSTGAASRLARPGIVQWERFGSKRYSEEELVAEIGAALLCGEAAIEPQTIENSAAYIAGWLKALKDDRKLLLKAASQAQRAADYILGKTEDTANFNEKAEVA